METIANSIQPEKYQALKEALTALERADKGKAQSILESLVKGSSGDIQSLFFIEAINKRLDAHALDFGNLYLMPDQGQQIRMFNFMAQKFPLVSYSQELVNESFCRLLKPNEPVVILDIGLGTGQQMGRFVELAKDKGLLPNEVTIIGIEPAQESLKAAGELFSRLGVHFVEIPKAIEELVDSDWQFLQETITRYPGRFFINASFALHHSPVDERDQLFSKLRQFKSDRLSIIEPYADFVTSNLLERFDNAWHHYGLTFTGIDQIDASQDEKNDVKKIFFSREIQDVLSEESKRIERFETGEMWKNRLLHAGFDIDPVPFQDLPNPCEFISVSTDNGYIGLSVNGYPIISIISGK